MKYLKKFEQQQQFDLFKDSEDFILPNVSFIQESNSLAYNPYVKETRVVCTYNVTNPASATKVCYETSGFTSMEVDGVLLDSVTTEYTFSTVGEHTVKFELADPTTIGLRAFYVCSGLTSIVIPDSVTSIGNSAFQNCSGLTSIDIPDSVTSIGQYTFQSCSGLTGELIIPNSITSIGYGAFQYCEGLTSIVIPDSVTSIGEGVFAYCYNLTSIDIPDSVTSIGQKTFNACGLTSVHIGSGVTSIGSSTFMSCTGLNEITCLAPTAPSISSSTFRFVKSGGILKVPAGSDYSSWMSTSNYYLGKYNWTIEYI